MGSFRCNGYASNESFLSCEEKEVRKSIKFALGCLPLTLSMDHKIHCNHTANFSEQSRLDYLKIVFRLDSYMPSNNCEPSCTKTIYDSYLIKSEASSNRVIQLIFQEDILVSESQPQYTFLPILTTLGGHIGVCRTLLWLLLGLWGLKTLYSWTIGGGTNMPVDVQPGSA